MVFFFRISYKSFKQNRRNMWKMKNAGKKFTHEQKQRKLEKKKKNGNTKMKTVRPSKFVSRIAGSPKHMLPGCALFAWTPTLSSTYMGMEETKKFVTSKPATCKTSHCQTFMCTSDVKKCHAAVARHIFVSQNLEISHARATILKFRCAQMAALLWREENILVKCENFHILGPRFEVQMCTNGTLLWNETN